MKTAADALFDKCVEVKLLKDGTVEIHCKLGLWSVSGLDREVVRADAMRYWVQYYHAGEYDEMLTKTADVGYTVDLIDGKACVTTDLEAIGRFGVLWTTSAGAQEFADWCNADNLND